MTTSEYMGVEDALDALGMEFRGGRWMCPAHDGKSPALEVTHKADRVLIRCHGGCETADVVDALGLTMRDLFDRLAEPEPGPVPEWAQRPYMEPGETKKYPYKDETGTVLYRAVRRQISATEKAFYQEDPQGNRRINGVRRVLYNLPAVVEAVAAGRTVHIAEGEKAATALHHAGEVATCNSGGADGWRDELADSLKGASGVVVWRDRDSAGAKWSEAVSASLKAREIPFRVVESRTPAAKDDAWDHLAAGWAVADALAVQGDVETVSRHLPDGFWKARPELLRIRQAAHAWDVSEDAVLYGVLTRLASMLPGDLRVATGIKDAASLNLFAALVAESGIGKSASSGLAAELLPVPDWLESTDGLLRYQDAMPIGTGEGLAEAYMGEVEVVIGSNKDGSDKKARRRRQVRHNASFYVDEGKTLTTLMSKREGSTLGQMIRTAWTGAKVGQMNGSAERTRVVEQYALGILVGFQPSTVTPLFEGVDEGTPQRFVYVAADNPPPDDVPEFPGALWEPDTLGVLMGLDPFLHGDFFLESVSFLLRERAREAMTVCDAVKALLRAESRARRLKQIKVDEFDSHRPLMMVKLSGLLAILNGRTEITEEDWSLAAVMWGTSCTVRGELLRRARAERDKAAKERVQAKTEEAVATRAAVAAADDGVVRVARRLHRIISAKGAMPKSELRRDLGRDKVHFPRALEHALARGWLAEEDSARGTRVAPGDSEPSA